MFKIKKTALIALFFSTTVLSSGTGYADTLMGALEGAYTRNKTLLSSRASMRATNENIAIAQSGILPQIDAGISYSRARSAATNQYTNIGSLNIQLNQKLFDGFQTLNSVSGAQASVLAQQQALRNEEQNQLNNAVAAYVNLYASRRIYALRHENLAALEEQVRAGKAKLDVGEGTRTDLAQSTAARSRAVSELSQALAKVKSDEATYYQVVGIKPGQLETPQRVKGRVNDLEKSFALADADHPAILSAQYAMQARSFNLKAKEGALLPQVDLSASASRNHVYRGSGADGRSNSVGVQVSVPIFHGGRTAAQIRQSREQLGEAQIQVDLYRNNVREALTSAWVMLDGSKSAVSAYDDSVRAAQVALDGRIEENRVGQATTIDVLNSRSQLIDMQIALVMAERDLVIADYNVRAAVGQMTADKLGLRVAQYNSDDQAFGNAVTGLKNFRKS